MLQESGTWDLRNMPRETSTSMQIYILFALFAFATTVVKLVRVWRVALPFRLSRHASNPALLSTLESSANSLKRWIGCTFLGWGILTSVSIAGLCTRLAYERAAGSMEIAFVAQDLSTALTMALIVILFSFLAR